jgi:hypothetical protein
MSLRGALKLARGLARVASDGDEATARPARGAGPRADVLPLRLRRRDGDPLPVEAPWCGWLEAASAADGLVGWVLDRHDPWAAFEVALVVGDAVVARARTSRHRGDLWAHPVVATDAQVAPGFCFDATAWEAVAALPAADPEQRVAVRLAQEEAWFGGIELPTVDEVRRWLAPDPDRGADRDGGALVPPPETAGLPLAVALERLAVRAAALQRVTRRADESSCIGYVELVAPLDAQRLVVGGWFRASAPRETALVVVADSRKIAAALVAVTHARDDLPADAVAFLGVLQGAWRPAGPHDPAFVFLAEGRDWLRTNGPLRIVGPTEVQARLGALKGLVTDPDAHRRLVEIERSLATPSRWAIAPDGGAAQGVAAGIDAVALLPGFGAVVTGWIVVASARVVDLALRVDGFTLDGDRSTLECHARHDLADAFPAWADRLAEAGFTAIVRGPLAPDAAGETLLAFDLDDGRRVVVAVPAGALRRIDASMPAERLERLVPSLPQAPWRDDFVRAWTLQARRQLEAGLRVLAPVRAPALLVVALPSARSERWLVLDRLAREAHRLPASAGLMVLTTPSQELPATLRWIEAVRAARAACAAAVDSTGLAVIPDEALALGAVLAVGHAAGATRLVFLGPELMPTAAGWKTAAGWLADESLAGAERPRFLCVEALLNGRPERAFEAGAFGWSRDAIERFLESAPWPLARLAHGMGLPGADGPVPAQGPAQAERFSRRRPSGFCERVDAAVRRAAGGPAREISR